MCAALEPFMSSNPPPRANALKPQEGKKLGVIPGRIFLFSFDPAIFGGVILEHVESDVTWVGHVFCGYEPLTARNGLEAVEILQHEKLDCVLMDIQMSEMSGIEDTEKIRANEKRTGPPKPVFISPLTANIVPADRQRCFETGMNVYLNKPVKLTLLSSMLAKVASADPILS